MPHGRGQYVSRLGMWKVTQTDLVAAAHGMHGWLRRPRPEDDGDEEDGAGVSEQPSRKAAKAAQRGGALRGEKGLSLRCSQGRPHPHSRSKQEREGGHLHPPPPKGQEHWTTHGAHGHSSGWPRYPPPPAIRRAGGVAPPPPGMALHATPKVMKLAVGALSRWLHERAPQLS